MPEASRGETAADISQSGAVFWGKKPRSTSEPQSQPVMADAAALRKCLVAPISPICCVASTTPGLPTLHRRPGRVSFCVATVTREVSSRESGSRRVCRQCKDWTKGNTCVSGFPPPWESAMPMAIGTAMDESVRTTDTRRSGLLSRPLGDPDGHDRSRALRKQHFRSNGFGQAL